MREDINNLRVAQFTIIFFQDLDFLAYGSGQNRLFGNLREIKLEFRFIGIVGFNAPHYVLTAVTNYVRELDFQFFSFIKRSDGNLRLLRRRSSSTTALERLERHSDDMCVFGRELLDDVFFLIFL